jgi:hypothetical protein
MGLQFEQITYASPFSLTQIVDDTAALRRWGADSPATTGGELEAWLNAIQLQCRPLIQSQARRADLEAWLEAADLATASSGA